MLKADPGETRHEAAAAAHHAWDGRVFQSESDHHHHADEPDRAGRGGGQDQGETEPDAPIILIALVIGLLIWLWLPGTMAHRTQPAPPKPVASLERTYYLPVPVPTTAREHIHAAGGPIEPVALPDPASETPLLHQVRTLVGSDTERIRLTGQARVIGGWMLSIPYRAEVPITDQAYATITDPYGRTALLSVVPTAEKLGFLAINEQEFQWYGLASGDDRNLWYEVGILATGASGEEGVRSIWHITLPAHLFAD